MISKCLGLFRVARPRTGFGRSLPERRPAAFCSLWASAFTSRTGRGFAGPRSGSASQRSRARRRWSRQGRFWSCQTLSSISKHYKFPLSDPWKKLSKKIQDIILYGSDEEEIKFSYDDNYQSYTTKKSFEGVVNNLERRYFSSRLCMDEWRVY